MASNLFLFICKIQLFDMFRGQMLMYSINCIERFIWERMTSELNDCDSKKPDVLHSTRTAIKNIQ